MIRNPAVVMAAVLTLTVGSCRSQKAPDATPSDSSAAGALTHDPMIVPPPADSAVSGGAQPSGSPVTPTPRGPAAPSEAPPANPPTGPANQSADAAAVLRQASAAYAAIRSLRMDFVLNTENPLLGRKTTSRGKISQRRPDRFLMRFSEPAGDVIVGDGQYFWVYYPSNDAKQVMRARPNSATGGLDLQAQFIGDPTRRFKYTDQGRADVQGRSARVITLVPNEPAGYSSLKVWIDERDHLVRRFELTNENGVVQHFELSNLELNPTLSNDLFRFTPPAGARVIEW